MSNSKAMVTLAVGKSYADQWERLCRVNWQRYADRHGYDLICFKEPLDGSERGARRSPSWQKCLVLGQPSVQKYERVVWMDSDILVNWASAPCVAAGVAVEKVGAVDAWSIPTPELSEVALQRLYEHWGDTCLHVAHTPREYYAIDGFDCDFEGVVQGGVLVLSPAHHTRTLEDIYFGYEETDKGNYETRALSYELLKAGLVQWIDHRFNLVWLAYKSLYYPFLLSGGQSPSARARSASHGLAARFRRKFYPGAEGPPQERFERLCATTAFLDGFFLHFAGAVSEMSLVDVDASSWRDLLA